ncbi:MAG: dihydrolipoyl dehydrogenase [Clostridiales bacterium]|jgi:dihydrolipoamide dehydrogenase|nr:dihydrolipoyl dehydrogenase [Clostridiales bacterium]
MENICKDVMIIGGGPAGYLAAERAAAAGLSVTLFEARALGGVCLNEGCIPTKTLLYSAKMYDNARNGAAYGVYSKDVELDHNAVMDRKDKVVKTLVSGVEAKMRAHKIEVVRAAAIITGRRGGEFAVSAKGRAYHGRHLLIATGSAPIVPQITGMRECLASGHVLTSREILDLRAVPGKLAVIGGGVVGLEMAAYFAAAGAQIIVIEMMEKIGGYIDNEIAEMLMKQLQKKGIEFHTGCRVTGVSEKSLTYEKDGVATFTETEAVLAAIGRAPRISGLGLETIGIHTEHGAIVTDKHLRTNISGAYAIGDVNGKSMLAHTAYREAEVAINHIMGKSDNMRYDAIPAVIYTAPEVAAVGETEESARDKGLDFAVKRLSMRYSGRFVAENDGGDGLCKLLIENGTNRLIGVHLIGSYASEIIYGAAMMIESRWPVSHLQELVFPHPTVCEIIRETLFS